MKPQFLTDETLVVLNPAYVIAKVCYLYAGFLFFADFSGDISNVQPINILHYGKFYSACQ